MQRQSFTVIEQTPMLLSLAILLIAASLVSLSVLGAQSASRQSAFTVCAALVTFACVGMGLLLQYTHITLLHADMGLNIALAVLCALGAIAGLHDRLGALARMCVAMGIAVLIITVAIPLQNVWFGASGVASVYGGIISAGMALLVLCLFTMPHQARFTQRGAMRIGASPQNWAMVLACFGLAIGLSLLLWRIKAFDGVNTSFHVYSALMASLVCASVAAMTARARRSPFILKIASFALPAGVLAAGAFDVASIETIMVAAAVMGAVVALTFDALIIQRIDEPSGVLVALTMPAIMAWLMASINNISLLAPHLQMLGFWLASASIIALITRTLCAALIGFTSSHRRLAEGMDATSAL